MDGTPLAMRPRSARRGFWRLTALAGAALAYSAMAQTQRVSVSSLGEEGNAFSMFPWPSADGRTIVFESDAYNLVPDDDNCATDVFVHDCLTRTTERVSLNAEGEEAHGASQRARVSGDGRFVVFQSSAENLAPRDGNGVIDVFVVDRWTKQVLRASEGAHGEEGNGPSIHPKISADGRWVAFHSMASNWAVEDTNRQWDVYLKDLASGDIELVSVSDAGVVGNDWSEHCSLSGDGRFVAYHSKATNLVADDRNGKDDIFLFDRQTRRVKRLSVGSTGEEGNGTSGFPSVSEDGRFVGFESDAANLVPGDSNGKRDVFVYEVSSGALSRVSAPASGQANGDSMRCSLSARADLVAYFSQATNLVGGDDNGTVDVFIWDSRERRTLLGNPAAGGGFSRGGNQFPVLSGDGRVVTFHAFATDIVPDDRNSAADVFVCVLDPSQ